MEDTTIVTLFRDRDENAIRYAGDKYGKRLRALSLGITGDEQTAEECENDTYLEAWNRIPPADPSDYLYAFLARIARHLSLDRCRERKTLKRDAVLTELSEELESCLPTYAEGPEQELETRQLGETIGRFLKTQSQEKRVIFLRRYFYLDPVSEISRRFRISESKVKTTLFRLRNELRAYLIKEGYTL